MIILTRVFVLFGCLVGIAVASCTPPLDASSVYDSCTANGVADLAEYLSTNGTAQGGVASLLNVAGVIGSALSYSGSVLPTLQNVTVVEALTVEALVSTNTSVGPYFVDLAQLTAAANFPLDPTTKLPLLTQPYAGTYVTDWNALLAQLAVIATKLDTIQATLASGLTTQVPLEVNNDGTYTGRAYQTVQLSDLVYTALFQPNVVVSDHDDQTNIVASQPIVSAFITPYMDPPALGAAGTVSCNTNFAGLTNAPGWPFGTSYGGNDQVVVGTVGTVVTNGVTGVPYESVSTCAYDTNFGDPLSISTKTSYGLHYGDNEYTSRTSINWPYCSSSSVCGSF